MYSNNFYQWLAALTCAALMPPAAATAAILSEVSATGASVFAERNGVGERDVAHAGKCWLDNDHCNNGAWTKIKFGQEFTKCKAITIWDATKVCEDCGSTRTCRTVTPRQCFQPVAGPIIYKCLTP